LLSRIDQVSPEEATTGGSSGRLSPVCDINRPVEAIVPGAAHSSDQRERFVPARQREMRSPGRVGHQPRNSRAQWALRPPLL